MTSPEQENVRIGCKDVLVGRVDLVRALSSSGVELQEALAGLLGFEREPEVVTLPPEPGPAPGQPLEPQPEPPTPKPLLIDVPFWRAHDFESLEPLDGEDLVAVEPEPPSIEPVALPPESLASGTEILTRLRRNSAFSDPSGRIDLDRTVARLSRGEFLRVFPRRPRKCWGQSIQVIIDRSRRLAPFWLDQDMVVTHLKRIYPQSGFQLAILEEGALEPRIQFPPEQEGRNRLPDPGSVVLVLGDLGCLTRPREYRDRLKQVWLGWGRRFQANSNPALAIVPCHPNRCGDELGRLWTILPWEAASPAGASPSLGEDDTEDLTDQLLTRLAFALRVEPRLVRAIRRTIFEGRADAGIEAHLWQHEAFVSRHHEAATFDPRCLPGLLIKFFQLKREERKRIYTLVRELRRDVYPGVWFSELLTLERDVPRGLLDPAEIRQAAWWYQQRKRRLLASGAANDPSANEPTWFRQVFARLPESVNQGIAARVLHEIEAVIRPDGEDRPPFLVPELLPAKSKTRRLMALWQVADRLVARPFVSEQNSGSLLGLISTRNGLIQVDPHHQFWPGGIAPGWAADWGHDSFGAWVLLRVGEATQRLRWVPPDRFLMGSPEDEPERFSDEGPRHEETIPAGFWIFDTPCTQALWEAVMGDNPSRQRGRDRPVEWVTWDRCQGFLKALNSRIEGMRLSLPSEVQWEYACRAGTETARYREDLDQIAWYGENSGGETHPVGQKAPNDLGLYDTLGNVYEWCQDEWTDNYQKKALPRGTRPASVPHIIRGGSWHSDSENVRAAFRDRVESSGGIGNLGFRCVELSAPGPVDRTHEGELARKHSRGRDPSSGPRSIYVDASGMEAVAFETLAPVRVRSDLERFTLLITPLPSWASAVGRDQYGLWAEFTIEPQAAKAPEKSKARKKKVEPPIGLGPVRQRLRWIPPGRFLMGSPDDEEGRGPDEGPRLDVTIGSGFWMFDTPCTQALWEALMGSNPSRFISPDRPVENVSWDACQKFVEEINKKIDLTLALPSEAQWEYACRAGTSTATYAGPLKIEGQHNAPILHEIAWYGGNSGVDFELSKFSDASKWPEKQFEFDKAGTHPVARKRANPWGLYDMLGNVWEWCDNLRESESRESSRPSAGRAIRGGSWGYVARDVRAASRGSFGRSVRYGSLGFRCAEHRTGESAPRAGDA